MVMMQGPERAEARNVLAGPEARAGRDLALLQVAAGQVVEHRDAGDVVEGVLLLHAERALADHEHQLGLVVQMRTIAAGARRRVSWPVRQELSLMKAGRLVGHLPDQVGALEFFQMRAVVLADAEELVGIGNRRQKAEFRAIEQHAGRQLRSGSLCARRPAVSPGPVRVGPVRAAASSSSREAPAAHRSAARTA